MTRPHDNIVKVIRLDAQLAQVGTPWVIATYNAQPYAFTGDNEAVIMASPGTVFAVTGDHQLTVKEGSVVVVAGKTDIEVRTQRGSVNIAHDSTAGVAQDHFGGVRIANMGGAPAYFEVASTNTQTAKRISAFDTPVATLGSNNDNKQLTAEQNNANLKASQFKRLQTANNNAGTVLRDSQFSLNKGAEISLENPGAEYTNSASSKQRIEIASNHELSLVRSQIAAVGVSDFVPLLEAGVSENVSGLKAASRKLELSAKDFGDPVACVNRSDMSDAQNNAMNRAVNDLTNAGHKLPKGCYEGFFDPNNSASLTVIPIAHFETVPMISAKELKHDMVTIMGNKCIRTSDTKITESADGSITVNSGEFVIDASKNMVVNVGTHKLNIRKGTIVLISKNHARTKVFNLCDSGLNSISINTPRGEISTSAGQELVLDATMDTITAELKSDGIARRRLHVMDTASGGSMAAMSEFSIVSLFQNNDSLKHVFHRSEKDAKSMSDRIMKMGVCLQQVTGSRGAYSQVASVPRDPM